MEFLKLVSTSKLLPLAKSNIFSLIELGQNNVATGIDQPLTFIAGFRQYVSFHLHSMKQQLHAKMRKRVEAFERVIIQARRDPIGTKNWKEQHVGIGEAEKDLEEEKKTEDVFIHTK